MAARPVALTTQPDDVRGIARQLSEMQRQWSHELEMNKPIVPLAAFGEGMLTQGKQLMDVVQRGHDVRLAHARRLSDAGADACVLADRVEQADRDAGKALHR